VSRDRRHLLAAIREASEKLKTQEGDVVIVRADKRDLPRSEETVEVIKLLSQRTGCLVLVLPHGVKVEPAPPDKMFEVGLVDRRIADAAAVLVEKFEVLTAGDGCNQVQLIHLDREVAALIDALGPIRDALAREGGEQMSEDVKEAGNDAPGESPAEVAHEAAEGAAEGAADAATPDAGAGEQTSGEGQGDGNARERTEGSPGEGSRASY
jgi:hypothetical protein